ncbi:6328_t:CDS:2 [Cetraspora pellucida]|uniref:6328_t:CDS:1 n=1 Tax=Cetraspora pellucida TaxID=1433469 RepID=A0A9N9EUX0_9GLOM|nr:6328_t:CDS:2 [Cetraspora pellucida]
MKEIGEENSNYSMDHTIKWKSPRRSFQYYIVKEGIYPPKSYLAYTRMPGHYPIPDNYVVETTYGKNEKTVTCFINYHDKKPQYKIKFGLHENEYICSNLSPTAAANAYLKAYHEKVMREEKAKDPNLQQRLPDSRMNGIYLFGLQLIQIKLVRENSMKKHKNVIKPFGDITRQMQFTRNKNFSMNILPGIESQIKQYFAAEDKVTINELVFTVNKSKVRIMYQPKEDEVNQQMAIIQAMDYNRISRSSYRALAAICQDLPREWIIFERLNQINQIMSMNILIHLVELQQFKEKLNTSLEIHIMDPDIINGVESTIGKGARRSIKDILRFLIPSMINKGILNYSEQTLHIRISGDGRNVGQKVKHVMVTFTVLNKMNIFKSNSHFALLIYSGVENYNTLNVALAPLIAELYNLKTGFIDENGYKWKIKLYISADWKFLSICLGYKLANSANFCLWCSIDKSQNGILEINNQRQDNWVISKNMEEIKQYYQSIPGHKHPPLFLMIPICNWIVDELHLML